MTLVQIVTLYINYKGTGLSNYSASFSTYLIQLSIGNYSGSNLTASSDGLILVVAPAVSYLALLIFYIIWKFHYKRTIEYSNEDDSDVKPEKFTLEIQGLDENYVN